MSIEKAIERIGEYTEDIGDEDIEHCLKILREEAEPPCPRCEFSKKKSSEFVGEWIQCLKWDAHTPVCKHFPGNPDMFQPRETADE